MHTDAAVIPNVTSKRNQIVNTSHYPAATVIEKIERHTLSVLVDNEPGVLARVIGLFSGRGYNIDSLTVSETEHEKHLSRITVVTTGTPMVIEQIKNQLARLVPVHRVIDHTVMSEVAPSSLNGLTRRRSHRPASVASPDFAPAIRTSSCRRRPSRAALSRR